MPARADSFSTRLRRRVRTVPAVGLAALLLVACAPLWIVGGALFDLVTRRRRLPTVRLLAFATAWAWLEVAGVSTAVWWWITGRAGNLAVHYRLQNWWVRTLLSALRATTGITIVARGAEHLQPGPVIMLCRHASLADSLVSAWVCSELADMRPHYVLKRELLSVPNLDVVGNRLPNYFLDRSSADPAAELVALSRVASRLGDGDVMVIFPEGTRSTASKRQRALTAIESSDPQRAQRLGALRSLMPPRPAGTLALLGGCPSADVAVSWHSGFDGWDNFASIRRALARRPDEVRFEVERIRRADVPETATDQARWLDDVWLELDRRVSETPPTTRRTT